jgi:hypothetical protein
MKRLNVILFSIIACNFAFGNSNVVVTGVLERTSIPSYNGATLLIDILGITNDTASFVLIKNGDYISNLHEFGMALYSRNAISLYGNICAKQGYYGVFYELDVKAHLKNIPSNRFNVECINNALDYGIQATPPRITIENDSVIIQHIVTQTCGAHFALRISDVINDTLYVALSDTSTMHANCVCNYEVRISATKSTSQTLKVHYNGVVYDLDPSDIKQTINRRIQVSPNPTEGIVEITGIEDFANLDYEIYNSNGQIIQSGKLRQTIDLSNIKGLYVLTIKQNQVIIAQEKIIVK